jgi:hypothetical protein
MNEKDEDSQYRASNFKKNKDKDSQYHSSNYKKKEEKKDSSFLSKAWDYEKSLGLGVAQGAGNAGASILNWPIQGLEKLSGKKIPHVPHPDFINEYYPDSTAGNVGKGIGNFIGGATVPVGGAARAGYNALRAVPGIKGALSRVAAGSGTGAITGAATNEGNRLEGAVIGGSIGGAGSAIPEIYSGARNAINHLRTPSQLSAQREEQLGQLLNEAHQAKNDVNESQLTAAQLADRQHKENLTAERQSIQNIERLFTNHPDRELTTRQVGAIRTARNDMSQQFNQRYGQFNTEGGGQKTVNQPYQENELTPHLQNIGANKAATRRMGNRLEPHTIETSILREDGRPYSITIPSQNGRVSDYVELMRETRDASQAAFAQARHADTADRLELLARGRALRNLSQDAERRVHGSLDPHEIENFQQIQHDYGTYFAPFNNSNTLRQIYYNGEYKPGLLKKMIGNTENIPLHDYLNTNYPAYTQSHIASRFSGKGHPLYPGTLGEQSKNITNLGRSEHEVWNMLSHPQREALGHHVNVANRRDYVTRLKEAITTNPLGRAINDVEISSVKGLNQATRNALNSIEHAQNHEAELIRQAKLLKLPNAELKRMQQQIKTAKNIGGVALKGMGLSHLMDIANKFIK